MLNGVESLQRLDERRLRFFGADFAERSGGSDTHSPERVVVQRIDERLKAFVFVPLAQRFRSFYAPEHIRIMCELVAQHACGTVELQRLEQPAIWVNADHQRPAF